MTRSGRARQQHGLPPFPERVLTTEDVHGLPAQHLEAEVPQARLPHTLRDDLARGSLLLPASGGASSRYFPGRRPPPPRRPLPSHVHAGDEAAALVAYDHLRHARRGLPGGEDVRAHGLQPALSSPVGQLEQQVGDPRCPASGAGAPASPPTRRMSRVPDAAPHRRRRAHRRVACPAGSPRPSAPVRGTACPSGSTRATAAWRHGGTGARSPLVTSRVVQQRQRGQLWRCGGIGRPRRAAALAWLMIASRVVRLAVRRWPGGFPRRHRDHASASAYTPGTIRSRRPPSTAASRRRADHPSASASARVKQVGKVATAPP